MIGPTGVGKTEIARRMAKLVGAPFVKVEATKFTEVGYVGRDVESMVRDLVETYCPPCKEKMASVKERAEENANRRLIELLVPSTKKQSNFKNPLEVFFGGSNNQDEQDPDENSEDLNLQQKRNIVADKLAKGELEE